MVQLLTSRMVVGSLLWASVSSGSVSFESIPQFLGSAPMAPLTSFTMAGALQQSGMTPFLTGLGKLPELGPSAGVKREEWPR